MRKGFTLVEIMITVGIIAVLSAVVTAAVLPAWRNARDKTRQVQLNEIGRFLLTVSCYVPSTGPGDYDLQTVYEDLVAANPNVAEYVSGAPRDPRQGTSTVSGYRYAYAADGSCAMYANLENPDAKVTLDALTGVTPGGGTGVLKAAAPGPNGSDRYYQVAH